MNGIISRILRAVPWAPPLAMAISGLWAATLALFYGEAKSETFLLAIAALATAWGLWQRDNSKTMASDVKLKDGKTVEDKLNGHV